MMKEPVSASLYNDYVQSANVLFHFMERPQYLISILQKKAIVPRYCRENVEYLNLTFEGKACKEVAILQKCFCDIPFHKLMERFELNLEEDSKQKLSGKEKAEIEKRNTHPDCYGPYAIALSKDGGENHQLLPVHYVNEAAEYTQNYSALLCKLYEENDLDEVYSIDIINRLAFMKPFRGRMARVYRSDSGDSKVFNIIKNFHDEREWRYVPNEQILSQMDMSVVIANPYLLQKSTFQDIPYIDKINKQLEKEQYREIWLDYDYNDIRYILVPDSQARIDMINAICAIPDIQFSTDGKRETENEKHILISKILVLDEIRKNW